MIFEKFVPSDVACVHTRDRVVHQELGVEIGNAYSRRHSTERLTEVVAPLGKLVCDKISGPAGRANGRKRRPHATRTTAAVPALYPSTRFIAFSAVENPIIRLLQPRRGRRLASRPTDHDPRREQGIDR